MRIRNDWTSTPSQLGHLAIAAGLVLLAWMLAEQASGGQKRSEQNGDLTAEQMMVRAHEARAVWRDFPGFTADIVVSSDGSVAKGTVTITADGEVELGLPEGTDAKWIERKLESLAAHRRPSDEREYNVSFADEKGDHPFGRLIAFNEDRLHSLYRIEGDVIREVHRTMGETRFTISVIEITRNPEEKYLPALYTVSYWDAKSGDLTRTDVVSDKWTRVGEFDLPARLLNVGTTNDGQRSVREIEFRNHRLLTAATAN